ncbi:MAG TPA: hypothetical protein ENN69_04940 [Spirochaetia bacterium]|nr:hypothetical protein [Spirochaetia bacterium]
MSDYSLLYFLFRLLAGALAAFFAILFWARNRDAAWTVVIMGILVLYLHIIFELLVKINLVVPAYFMIGDVSLFEGISLFLSVVPFVLFSAGFIIMLIRNR